MDFACPHCNNVVSVSDGDLNKTVVCPFCGKEFFAGTSQAGTPIIQIINNISPKSSGVFPEDKNWVIYFLLWFFFGVLGIHNLYAGKIARGLIELICTITVILFPITLILWIIDFVEMLIGILNGQTNGKFGRGCLIVFLVWLCLASLVSCLTGIKNASDETTENKVRPLEPYESSIIKPRLVKIPGRNYSIGKYEVTQREYVEIMNDNPSLFLGDDIPVEAVTWHEAVKFCEQLTARERAAGRLSYDEKYSLPTSEQWEFACRAGTTTRFCSGNSEKDLSRVAWWDGNSDGSARHRVGTKEPNAWGIYDMHGSVWEWCLDVARDPRGRVLRGGGWNCRAQRCASSSADYDVPERRDGSLGFRVALVADIGLKVVPMTQNYVGRNDENESDDEEEIEKTRKVVKRENKVPEKVVPVKRELFVGQIFDVKRSADRKEVVSGTQKTNEKLAFAFRLLNKNFKKGEGAWDLKKLSNVFDCGAFHMIDSPVFVPRMLSKNFLNKFDSPQTTGVFGPGFVYVFKGKFSVPRSEFWRFVGNADDVMFVAVGENENEMQTVFCAFSPKEGHGPRILGKKKQNAAKNSIPATKKSAKGDESLQSYCENDGKNVPAGTDIKNGLFKGPWLVMKKGQNYSVIIAMGISGTTGAFALGMQERGVDTDENFPVFTLNPPAAGTGFLGTGKYNSSCTFSPTNPRRNASD